MKSLVDIKRPALKCPSSITPILVVVIITIVCLAPFVAKAFHIDDTLFLWAAKHIQTHPVDFYGFTANWYGTEMPMYSIQQNPPLVSYYIAIVALLFGWNEVVLHLAFLIPGVGLSLGTYYLARQLCQRPHLAALMAVLLTPVFLVLVSSTNVMCDVMMVAFYVWAVVLWLRGLHWLNRESFMRPLVIFQRRCRSILTSPRHTRI
jgi:4-amino-4-deoxy-L-arabinose transferase-like glycosyltransferase